MATFGKDPADPLFNVAAGLILGDTVVIANGGSKTIHVYLRSGPLVAVSGGEGGGPGEFERLSWLQEHNGEVLAYDGSLRRLSRFSANGEFITSTRLEAAPRFGFPTAVGVFGDGSILVAAAAAQPRPEGAYRPQMVLLRYGEDGAYRDSLGPYVGDESYSEAFGRGGQMMGRVFFGRRSAVAVRGARYYVLENDDDLIEVFDTAGTRVGELKLDETPVPAAVTEGDFDVIRQRLAADAPPQMRLTEFFDRMPRPSQFPVYGWDGARELKVMRVDRARDVWVLHHGGVRDLRPRWTVFSPAGVVRGQVRAPEELDILDSADGWALVLRWSDLDVETVELRPLIPEE